MKLKDALELYPALASFSKIKLPIKAAYRIGRCINALEPEVKAFEERRNALLRELGKPMEAGDAYQLGENVKQFNEQMEELANEEVEVKLWTIKLPEIAAIEVESSVLAKLIDTVIFDDSESESPK